MSHDMDAVYGEVTKAWEPQKATKSPEEKRLTRADRAQTGATAVGVGAGAGAAWKGNKARLTRIESKAIGPLHDQGNTALKIKAGKQGVKAGKLAAVSAAGFGTAEGVRRYKNSKGFQPYAKSASTSAFGITHD